MKIACPPALFPFKILLSFLFLLMSFCVASAQQKALPIAAGPFKPTEESLKQVS
jgi:hypothetical protein